MDVQIELNGINNPFSNISFNPPYVTKSITPVFGAAFDRSEIKYTFNGQITGSNFANIKNKVDTLFNNFSQGFYPYIKIDGEYNECCKLDSINIDSSNYVGIVPYTVELSCYDKTNGISSGVKNVSREISYQEGEDKLLQISHKISVDGIRTSTTNNALTNAKNFLIGLTGRISDFGPFINGASVASPTLLNQKETINPIEGSISIEESYVVDTGSAGAILRYTINIDSGVEDGNVTLSVNGDIRGGKTYNFSSLKSKLSSLNFSNLPYGLTFADFKPNGENYEYNGNQNILTFSQSYTNDDRVQNETSKSYSIDINCDFIESINKINYKSDIKPTTNLNYTNSKTEFQSIKDGLGRINDLLSQTSFLSSVVDKTNLHLTSTSITVDENNATISASESYDDKNSRFGDLINIDLNIKITPAIDRYNYTPILNDNGSYVIENLKYKNRCILSINGSASIDVSKTSINSFTSDRIANYANFIRNKYLQGTSDLILTKSNISINKENATCSFDVEYTSETSQYI